MARQPDLVVSIAPPGSPSDRSVAVVGDYVVDITGATDGQVLTIQPDGSVAAEDPFDLDAMRFKGVIDASGNPNYPAAEAGDVYRISVAGKVGGAAGVIVEVSDLVFATADNAGGTQAAVGASWSVEQGNITIDTDGTMAANSDALVPSQKAVKTYADGKVVDSIADADTTHAPSRNAVFDALSGKADLASPALTGNPTAPTPAPGDADTSIATTGFVATVAGLLVPKSLYDAGTVIVATVDDTPVAKTFAEFAVLTGARALIERKVLSGAAATLDFTGIPATFESLFLVVVGRGDTAAGLVTALLTLNNDTAANYDWEPVSGNAGAASSSQSIGDTKVSQLNLAAANASAGACGMFTIRIPGYARTVFRKQMYGEVSAMIAADAGGAIVARAMAAQWRSTAAVNRITLTASAGNFITGTVASLYGEG